MAVVAVLLVALGVAVELWVIHELGWRRALGHSDQPPDPALPRLVFAGPFRIVRHPQTLGLLLILVGACLAGGGVLSRVVAGVAGALVIARAVSEDQALARQWGEAHARYRRAVPLLLPRWRPREACLCLRDEGERRGSPGG
jgi:protein-S-isoprenylcysteine O-methyltransferase Ste14